MKDLDIAEHEFQMKGRIEHNLVWIEKLLKNYYDPLYSKSFSKRNPTVRFRGTPTEVQEYLETSG